MVLCVLCVFYVCCGLCVLCVGLYVGFMCFCVCCVCFMCVGGLCVLCIGLCVCCGYISIYFLESSPSPLFILKIQTRPNVYDFQFDSLDCSSRVQI